MNRYDVGLRICAFLGAMMMTGCGGDGTACVPNAQETCSCGDRESFQVCNAAGNGFGPCLCGGDAGPIEVPCTEPTDCDDGNPCTSGSCDAGRCVYSPASGSCDDGDACSTNDLCRDGVCRGDGVCADLECAADALHTYLDTTTFCIPEADARAAVRRLSTDYPPFVNCAATTGCTSGCPITITSTSVSSSYTGAVNVGDTATLSGTLRVQEISFSFTTSTLEDGCEFTGTISYGAGQSALVDVTHELAEGVCFEPASMTTASFSLDGATTTRSGTSSPLPGSTATQQDCDDTLGTLMSYTGDFYQFDDVLLEAFGGWAHPNCRECADACEDGLRCEMVRRVSP